MWRPQSQRHQLKHFSCHTGAKPGVGGIEMFLEYPSVLDVLRDSRTDVYSSGETGVCSPLSLEVGLPKNTVGRVQKSVFWLSPDVDSSRLTAQAETSHSDCQPWLLRVEDHMGRVHLSACLVHSFICNSPTALMMDSSHTIRVHFPALHLVAASLGKSLRLLCASGAWSVKMSEKSYFTGWEGYTNPLTKTSWNKVWHIVC